MLDQILLTLVSPGVYMSVCPSVPLGFMFGNNLLNQPRQGMEKVLMLSFTKMCSMFTEENCAQSEVFQKQSDPLFLA